MIRIALLIAIFLASCNFLPVGQVVYEKQSDGWQVKYFIASYNGGVDQKTVDDMKALINKNLK